MNYLDEATVTMVHAGVDDRTFHTVRWLARMCSIPEVDAIVLINFFDDEWTTMFQRQIRSPINGFVAYDWQCDWRAESRTPWFDGKEYVRQMVRKAFPITNAYLFSVPEDEKDDEFDYARGDWKED